jgi:hypothetical protein
MQNANNVIELKGGNSMKVVNITPEIARTWLDSNVHNRPVRETTIRRYVEAMKSGHWELNGETIKFSEKGVLLDGQHRLRAIVQSGVAIQSYVIHDLPSRVFDTIDTGANRSIGDLLALQGEQNNLIIGPALRMLFIQDELGSVREMSGKLARIVTNRDLLETLDRHQGLVHSISFIGGLAAIKKYLSVPIASFCHYLFSKIQPHHADAFFIKLARSTDLDEDSPILMLRQRLEGMSKSSIGDRLEAIAITIKSWNAYREQRTIRSLRWSKIEDFPVAK